jgi:hypothetical protein
VAPAAWQVNDPAALTARRQYVAAVVPDGHPLGEPVIPNGLALCKLHHAAFDAYIIGVTPDLEVTVRLDVLQEIDGPMLQHGLQGLRGPAHPRAARRSPQAQSRLPRRALRPLPPRELTGRILSGPLAPGARDPLADVERAAQALRRASSGGQPLGKVGQRPRVSRSAR